MTVVDLTGLAPSDGFIIQGDAAGDAAGASVSSAGDVNGDGIDDVIVGAFLVMMAATVRVRPMSSLGRSVPNAEPWI